MLRELATRYPGEATMDDVEQAEQMQMTGDGGQVLLYLVGTIVLLGMLGILAIS